MKTLFLDPNPDSHKDLELIPETGSLMLPSYMVVLRKLRKEPPGTLEMACQNVYLSGQF
jgi:hypothetical protein